MVSRCYLRHSWIKNHVGWFVRYVFDHKMSYYLFDIYGMHSAHKFQWNETLPNNSETWHLMSWFNQITTPNRVMTGPFFRYYPKLLVFEFRIPGPKNTPPKTWFRVLLREHSQTKRENFFRKRKKRNR